MKIKQILLSLVAGFVLASQAQAVVINTSYDLNGPTIAALDNGTVSIGNGDFVEMTVNFANNQALTIFDGSEYFNGWLYAGDNNSTFTINNAVIEFLGFSETGGASSTYNLGTQSSGAAHIGPAMSNFLNAGQSVTFSGYRVSFDVQSIAVSPHDYSSLWFVAGSNTSIGPANVPEAGSAILMMLGLGLFFVGRRVKS